MGITNVGGSFTSAIVLTVLAWTVRWVRSRASGKAKRDGIAAEDDQHNVGKYFAILSPAAVRMLVETQPIAYVPIDIRTPEQWKQQPLPPELANNSVRIEAQHLGAALASDSGWRERIALGKLLMRDGDDEDAAERPPTRGGAVGGRPHPNTLLLLLTDDAGDTGRTAAALAARKVVVGGLAAWNGNNNGTQPGMMPRSTAPQLRYISRDAVAVLFGFAGGDATQSPIIKSPSDTLVSSTSGDDFLIPAHHANATVRFVPKGLPSPPKVGGVEHGTSTGPLLVDVRRHDERALYGSIPGAVHVPVEHFASALELPASEFARHYGFAKPSRDAVLVLQGRTSTRSSWAAVLAADAGYRRCFVYAQGSYGWRLHSNIMAYAAYELTGAPPEPEDGGAGVEAVDVAAGRAQLASLGL